MEQPCPESQNFGRLQLHLQGIGKQIKSNPMEGAEAMPQSSASAWMLHLLPTFPLGWTLRVLITVGV